MGSRALSRRGGEKRRLSRVAAVEAARGYLYILPWLLGFLIWQLGPMLASLYFSFTRYEFPLPPRWIGLVNYVKAFAGDDLFYTALGNTAYYVFLAVPLGLTASLFLAMLLDRSIKGRAILRTIFYLPAIVPMVASTFLFTYLLQPDYGLVNAWLWKLFRIEGPRWFNSKDWVKPTFILLALWGAGGPRTIIFLAGLQNIPTELYEAAEVDGANRWHKFLFITLPMLSPTIFFNLITGIIGAFKIFGPAYVATNGGPYYGSYFYVLHLFNTAFQYWSSGYASALAWILFLIILIFTLIQFYVARKWVYYESSTVAEPA
jgi:multiple sugar transport system permease protein